MPPGHLPFSPSRPPPEKRKAKAQARAQAQVHLLSATGLPDSVQRTLPTCAQGCLSSYIQQDFPCPNNDLSCLCSRYSSDSFTLGEYAYICLRSNCSGLTASEEEGAYSICAAQANAVPATHSVLTVPAPSPVATTPTSSTSRKPAPATQTATASPTLTLITSTAQPTASGEPTPTISSPDTSTPTSAVSASPTSAPAGSAALTNVQTIGISIAAVGVVLIVIAAALLCACRRRKAAKQRRERPSYDFVDNAPPRLSPFSFGAAHAQRSPAGFRFAQGDPSQEKRRTEWPGRLDHGARYHFPAYIPYQDLEERHNRGSCTGPPTPLAKSDYGMRTTSQLLPEKPTTLPLGSVRQTGDLATSPATVFEEEHIPTTHPAAALTGLSACTMSSQRPRHGQPLPQQMRPRDHVQPPPLALTIPKQVHQARPIQDLGSFLLIQPPAIAQSSSQENRLSERSQACTSNASVLNYYANGDDLSPDLYSSTPIEEQMQVRRAPPGAIVVTKPVYPPRAVRASGLSDHSNRTSFESTDPDEPTPPDEADKRLSPVAESPIATIKYPKIPRSSNQSVPRSPMHDTSARSAIRTEARRPNGTPRRRDGDSTPITPDQRRTGEHTPTLSGSTLAAKRRDDSLAHGRGGGFPRKHAYHSPNDSPMSSKNHNTPATPGRERRRHESPLKGYGRIANPSSRGPDWPLRLDLSPEMRSPPSVKSPLWEPKLTPRREGDDLYLDLSLATPRHTYFSQSVQASVTVTDLNCVVELGRGERRVRLAKYTPNQIWSGHQW